MKTKSTRAVALTAARPAKKTKTFAPRKSRKAKAAPSNVTEIALAKADIADRLDAATKTEGKFDREKAIAFAALNGIEKDWGRQDNGRCSMQIRNVIRARALKGERVVWAF
jgi:hypothetical protein